MQCARRWFDEGQTSHLVNLGKYVSAMLAAGAKVAYEKDESVGWLCLVVIMSSAATVYQLYWDFVKDWGLLQMNSKNPWLRNELMLRRKFIYYFSMVYTRPSLSLSHYTKEAVGHWHAIGTQKLSLMRISQLKLSWQILKNGRVWYFFSCVDQ